MQSFLVALVGFTLFCSIDALHVDRSHHFELQNDVADEDMVLMSGVPVYHYHQALKAAKDERAKRFILLNTTANESANDESISWIVMFHPNVTEEFLDLYCPYGETGEGHACNDKTGTVHGQNCDDTVFKNCKQHGNLTVEGAHGRGIAYVHVVCTESELQAALANEEVQKYAAFAEMDMKTSIDDVRGDYSRALIDDNENLEAATWGLNRINKDSAPAAGFGVHVYVLDTGVRVTHSQFEGRAVPQLESLGSARKCECQNATCSGDTHGHGTHCAGTVAGVDYGVAPQARIHSVKVLGDDGYGYTSWSIAAESWILSNGMRPAILSMSLGGAGNNYAEKNSLDALYADGVVVVVAAGNEADDACNYNPAWIPNVITTGSTTSSDSLSWFSNYGTCVNILAPGSSVLSAGISSDTSTSYKSGTSMACPHVSGAAAILLALNKHMTPAQVVTELLAESDNGAISSVPAGTPNKLLQVDSVSGR